ncbi:MAG: hypothetical protein MRERV_47c007 [Mycoplasmataceae bacterium RV_VA103A]|nr:MAG: hypothetical protein MRERV_47c007 [Mycoplasmataceae bacterium RV_VA103A]
MDDNWTKIIIALITLITTIVAITLSKILTHYFWLKRNEKVRSLEREVEKLKEDKKAVEENKTNDKEERAKLFKQLLREKEKVVRLEESVEKRELKDQIKQLESNLNEKENREKELNNRLSQSKTRVQQLENLIKNLRAKEISLQFKVSDLQKETKNLINVNNKLRLKLSNRGIKEEKTDLDDTPWQEWERKNLEEELERKEANLSYSELLKKRDKQKLEKKIDELQEELNKSKRKG